MNYIKIAVRNLTKNKLFTAINVLGLTIGLAGSMLIYVWVESELSFDRFYEEADQINRVYCSWDGGGEQIFIDAIPIRLKEKAEAQIPEIEDFYVLRPVYTRPDITTETGDVFREKSVCYVSANWMETFDYQPIKGSIDAFNAERTSIALTASYAEKYFGEVDPIGQTLTMDSTNYTVNLVLEDRPANSSFHFQLYLPLQSYWKNEAAYQQDYETSNFNYLAFFKADPTINRAAIADKLSAILNAENSEANNSCYVEPIGDMRFNEDLKDDYAPHQSKATVYSFGLIAFLLLLIAGLNYVNLSTALLNKNVKSIGVKKVLGASGQHIFTQVMIETLVVSLLAASLSIGVLLLALPHLGNFVEMDLTFDLNRTSVCLGLTGLIALNVAIAGIYPALLSAGLKPIRLIRTENSSNNGISFRQVLVVTQFTASVVVLISTFLIHRQLQYIQEKNVGYDRSSVIAIEPRLWRGPGSADNFVKFRTYKKELEQLAGFESIALTDASIEAINNQNSGSFDWEGKPENFKANVYQMRADEDLQEVFKLPLAQGRWFEDERSSDQNNIIINEAAVKDFNIPEPVIGRKVSFQGREGEIIGITENFNYGSLRNAVAPLVIWNSQGGGNKILARISSNEPQEVVATAKALFNDRIPGVDFEYDFIQDNFIQLHAAEQKVGTLFQIFSSLLIFISCLGLFGLAVFAAERRVKEIGIRKVLGASVTAIVALLSKDFVKLVVIAFVIATPIAYYLMNEWLQNFAYRIDMEWWVFGLAGAVAIGIALLTVSLQSVQAALADSVGSLRSE